MIEKMSKKINDLDLVNMSYDMILNFYSKFGWEIDVVTNDEFIFKRDTNLEYYNELVILEEKHKILSNRLNFLYHKESYFLSFIAIVASLFYILFWLFVTVIYILIGGLDPGILLCLLGTFPGVYYLYKQGKCSKRNSFQVTMCGILLRQIINECIKIKNQ